MKPPFRLAILLAASSLSARAVTFSIAAELLQDRFGDAMPETGLVILTAATEGAFNGPAGTDFVTGTEIELFRWDLTGGFGPGILLNETGDLSLTTAWNPSDPLRLYWYPDLNINSTGPDVGTYYGSYSDLDGKDGSAPWVTVNDSDTVSLKFYNADALFLNDGGSNEASAGEALLQVPAGPSLSPVPETGTVFGLSILIASALQIRLRRSRSSKRR